MKTVFEVLGFLPEHGDCTLNCHAFPILADTATIRSQVGLVLVSRVMDLSPEPFSYIGLDARTRVLNPVV